MKSGKSLLTQIMLIVLVFVTLACNAITREGKTAIPLYMKAGAEQKAIIEVVASKYHQKETMDKWQNVKITDFMSFQLSDADIKNGIQERMCFTLVYIEQNENGEWVDGTYTNLMVKKDNTWTIDDS